MAVSSSLRLGITLWTTGSDAFNRDQMSASHNALETVAAGYQQGTTRPAAAVSLKGFFYHHETTDVTSYCDGSTWHDLTSFSTPTDTVVGGTNVEGVANTAARSDHVHALADFGTAVEMDGSLSSGVATTFARADHKHSIGASTISASMLNGDTLTNDISGNAATATYADTAGAAGPSTTAETLVPGRTIEVTGDITSTPVLFDGSANIQVSASVDDNSHSHSAHTLSGDVTGTLGSTTVNSSADSDLLGGLALQGSGTVPSANQVLRSNGSGYVYAGWINTTAGATTSTPTRIYATNDAFLRYMTPANFRTQVTEGHYQGQISGASSGAGITLSTSSPSGGTNGDIWFKY